MIIFRNKGMVFASNPKTGTHTMYKMLQQFGGKRYGNYHHILLPQNFRIQHLFTTVREPLSRTVSGWNSLMFHEEKHRKALMDKIGYDDFASYCDWLCDGDPNTVYGGDNLSVIVTNQSRWLDQIESQRSIDLYIRTEHMLNDIMLLPIRLRKGYIPPQELKRTDDSFIQRQLNTLSGSQLNRLRKHLERDISLYEKAIKTNDSLCS